MECTDVEARDAAAEQGIEQCSEKHSGQSDHSGVKPKAQVTAGEGANPAPRPQEPEALDGIES